MVAPIQASERSITSLLSFTSEEAEGGKAVWRYGGMAVVSAVRCALAATCPTALPPY